MTARVVTPAPAFPAFVAVCVTRTPCAFECRAACSSGGPYRAKGDSDMRHSARRWVTVPLIAMAAVGFTAVVTGCGHKAVIQCEAKAPDPPPPAQPDPPPPPPAPPPPAPVADKIIIPGELEFASGSAQIRESTSSLDTLNSVSRLMTDHPEVTKLRIEGHTDDVGYPDYNMRLSQKRADAVRWWLVSRGID